MVSQTPTEAVTRLIFLTRIPSCHQNSYRKAITERKELLEPVTRRATEGESEEIR